MRRTWKLCQAALLAAALLSVQSSAVGQVEKGPDADKAATEAQKTLQLLIKLQESIDQLKKQGDDLQRQVSNLPDEQRIDYQIRKTLAKELKDTKDEMTALRQQLDLLQRDVASLKSGAAASPRVAFSSPATPGRIKLINTFPSQMTVIVNERSYRLAPGATEVLENIPAGQFTYQVLGVQPDMLVRSLAPNETFTITVYPR
jgi:TolA-binding protein